jgi:hypothetical protein
MRATSIPLVDRKTGEEITEATDQEIVTYSAVVATTLVDGEIRPVFVTVADLPIEEIPRRPAL